MRIAVTGCSGYLGRLLVARLERERRVEAILGLDLRSAASSPKLEFIPMDVREPELAETLVSFRTDCLVHLAWTFDPTHNRRLAWQVDVHGSQNTFLCAARAGVPRVVYPSSATAYGAYADNPLPIPESWPTRGRADFAYSAHKAEVESFLDRFEAEHPHVRVTRLRGAIVMGPRMGNFISRLLALPAPLRARPRGRNAALNLLHEEDAIEVLSLATLESWPGIYNVAAADPITVVEITRLSRRPFYELPDALLVPLMRILWLARLVPAPPSYLHFIRHSWVVDLTRLHSEFGYRPRHSSRQAVVDFARARGWLGPESAPAASA